MYPPPQTLTLVYGEKPALIVNKQLACSKSRFISQICAAEASDQEIMHLPAEHGDIDPRYLQYLVDFLEEGTYCCSRPTLPSEPPDEPVPRKKPARTTANISDEFKRITGPYGVIRLPGCMDLVKEILNSGAPPLAYPEDSTSVYDESLPVDKDGEPLYPRHHAKMYGLAYIYGVDSLREMAKQLYEETVRNAFRFKQEYWFLYSIKEAYTCTAAGDRCLKDIAVWYMKVNLVKLREGYPRLCRTIMENEELVRFKKEVQIEH